MMNCFSTHVMTLRDHERLIMYPVNSSSAIAMYWDLECVLCASFLKVLSCIRCSLSVLQITKLQNWNGFLYKMRTDWWVESLPGKPAVRMTYHFANSDDRNVYMKPDGNLPLLHCSSAVHCVVVVFRYKTFLQPLFRQSKWCPRRQMACNKCLNAEIRIKIEQNYLVLYTSKSMACDVCLCVFMCPVVYFTQCHFKHNAGTQHCVAECAAWENTTNTKWTFGQWMWMIS